MLQAIFSGPILDGAFENFWRYAGFQARQHFGPRPRVNRVPHFRLAAASSSFFMACGVIIIRMDLHGKFFIRENKFYEQRKRAIRRINSRPSPKRRQSAPHVAKLLPRERSGCEAAVHAGHPRFAQWLGQIGFFGERTAQSASAPRSRTEKRFQSRGAQRGAARIHAALPKKRARRRRPSSIRSIEVA